MKILRSVTRRGFEVGTAGWFTITGPRRWFPASRLPGGFQDFLDRPKRTEARIVASVPDQKILDRADSHETPYRSSSSVRARVSFVRFILG